MKKIENQIVSVLNKLQPYIPESERFAILNLVKIHGEYGVGMETLCSILEEKETPIPILISDEIIQIFREMEFSDDVLSYYLKHLTIEKLPIFK
jgi:hypothetical protein